MQKILIAFNKFINFTTMKKYLFILLVAVVGFAFTSCKNQPATVNVTVVDAWTETEPVESVDVCVFTSYAWENETHLISNAIQHKVTDANGLATFSIHSFWLGSKGTIMYVATFDAKGLAQTSKQITVTPGQTTDVELKF